MRKFFVLFSIAWLFQSYSIAKAPQEFFDSQDTVNQIVVVDTVSITEPSLADTQKFNQDQSNTETETSSKLYEFVSRWLGTPYRYGGSTKRGTDCSGFVSALHDSLYQIKLPRSSRLMYAVTKPISKAELKTGDLLFFKIGRGVISHVGIYLKDNKFAHATINGGVVVSDLDEQYYRRWYFHAGRLPAHESQPLQ